MTVGALRPPSWPRMPLENRWPSVKAYFGSWQEAQETVLSAETRLSKYSSQPSSAFWGEYGLSFGQKIGTSPSGIFGPSLGKGGISSPAEAGSPPRAPRAQRENQSLESQVMTASFHSLILCALRALGGEP